MRKKGETVATYSDGCIQFLYPDNFKMEKGKGGKYGNFRKFNIGDLVVRFTNPETKSCVQLCTRNLSFDKAYNTRCDPASPPFNTPQIEIIRAGDYCQFPGAKEIFVKGIMSPDSQSGYHWIILAPMTEYMTLEIYVSEYNGEDDLKQIWIPIVESVEYNNSSVSLAGIPASVLKYFEKALQKQTPEVQSIEEIPPPININIKRHNWAKIFGSKKPQHFSYTICPENGYISLYDSPLGSDFVGEFLMSTLFESSASDQIGAIKTSKCIIILPPDALDQVLGFHLNSEPPDESDPRWEQVIESIMTLDSGKMYIEAQSLPEVELMMKRGNYKLRVYFEAANVKEDSLNIGLYFWPTKEKETNEIKIIKACKRVSSSS